MPQERILVLGNNSITDQSEVGRLLKELDTPRGEEYVMARIGERELSVDDIVGIDKPEKKGILKMKIAGKDIVVNDNIAKVPDITIDISKVPPAEDGGNLHSVGYFTVTNTDLIIKVLDDARPPITTNEEVENTLLGMKVAIVNLVTGLQNK